MNQPEMYPISEIAETLAFLVKSLVRNPMAVKVTTSNHGSLVVFLIKVDQDDVKRVVGQKGRHFKALETTVKALAKLISLEAHLSLDESMPAVIATSARTSAFGTGDAKLLKSLPALLERLVEPFIEDIDSLKAEATEIGNSTAVVTIQVAESDYPAIYGHAMQFDYGQDGHLIGSIKNLVDGIGKNHGKVIKLVVTQINGPQRQVG